MSVIFLLLTVSTLVATAFLAGFIWAVRNGQYEDDRSPAVRILMDDGTSQPSKARQTRPSGQDDPSISSNHDPDLAVRNPFPPKAANHS